MRLVALLALAVGAQAIGLSPRELMKVARPLTTLEIASVIRASRAALAGKSLREISGDHTTAEVLMGPDGEPAIVRIVAGIIGGIVGGGDPQGPVPRTGDPVIHREAERTETVTTVVDYTGTGAHRCHASAEKDDFVVLYTRSSVSAGWSVTSRSKAAREREGARLPSLAMLSVAGALQNGPIRRIDAHSVRAFIAPWTSPPPDPRARPPVLAGDPIPNVVGQPVSLEARQLLWIDLDSLLPVRWEILRGERVLDRRDFKYEPIDIRRPANAALPPCVP